MQRARIRLSSTQLPSLKAVCEQIESVCQNQGIRKLGPIPLPTGMNKYTVLRSPHVDKKSREQFEIRTHRRLVDIVDPTPQTVDALLKLDLPSGVDVEIKQIAAS